MPAFFFYIAFSPHENSSLPRLLNWTKGIYVGCVERKGFVRFQGRHGTLRVGNSLAETWGITILSLNLHAYDQTWPHFAFAAWLPNLWSCPLETKGSKSNQRASFNGNRRSSWCHILLWLIVWMWQMLKTCPCTFLLAHGSANITKFLNSSCHGAGEPPPHEKRSPPLLPDNIHGKINPFKWWRILFDSIFLPLNHLVL